MRMHNWTDQDEAQLLEAIVAEISVKLEDDKVKKVITVEKKGQEPIQFAFSPLSGGDLHDPAVLMRAKVFAVHDHKGYPMVRLKLNNGSYVELLALD